MKAVDFILKVWGLSLFGGSLLVSLYLEFIYSTPDYNSLIKDILQVGGVVLCFAIMVSIPILVITVLIALFIDRLPISTFFLKAIIALIVTIFISLIYLYIERPDQRPVYNTTVIYPPNDYKDFYYCFFYWIVALLGVFIFKIEPKKLPE